MITCVVDLSVPPSNPNSNAKNKDNTNNTMYEMVSTETKQKTFAYHATATPMTIYNKLSFVSGTETVLSVVGEGDNDIDVEAKVVAFEPSSS